MKLKTLTESFSSPLLDCIGATERVGAHGGSAGVGPPDCVVLRQRWVSGSPVGLQIDIQSLTRIVQLILIQHHIKHVLQMTPSSEQRIPKCKLLSAKSTNWGTLGQLIGCHELHIQVSTLRLSSRLDKTLQHLQTTQEFFSIHSSGIVHKAKHKLKSDKILRG